MYATLDEAITSATRAAKYLKKTTYVIYHPDAQYTVVTRHVDSGGDFAEEMTELGCKIVWDSEKEHYTENNQCADDS